MIKLMNLVNSPQGILIVDKPAGMTSFSVVSRVRKLSGQKKVGHAGTLDPFATGVLILLLGRDWTRKADLFLTQDKEYRVHAKLGQSTDSYDRDGLFIGESDVVPTVDSVEELFSFFQGEYMQTPPMFSAKKKNGVRLYKLARKGVTIERAEQKVSIQTTLLSYEYPDLYFDVHCSKGTYIRSIVQDMGERLGSLAYTYGLVRTRSGLFTSNHAVSLEQLEKENIDAYLQHPVVL